MCKPQTHSTHSRKTYILPTHHQSYDLLQLGNQYNEFHFGFAARAVHCAREAAAIISARACASRDAA
eukprot:6191194-Pleurochrysis_carterae.AAC.5